MAIATSTQAYELIFPEPFVRGLSIASRITIGTDTWMVRPAIPQKEVIKKEVRCSRIRGYKRLNHRLFTSGSIETSEII